MIAATWFCEIDGQKHGPLTPPQLKQLAVAGRLQPAHPVWKDGMQTRVPARTVKGLFGDAPAPAAAPPPVKSQEYLPDLEPISKPADPSEDLVEVEMIEEVVEVEAEIEEVVEVEEEKPAGKKGGREKEREPKEEPADDEPAVAVLAEALVTYREGLPELKGPITAQLLVENIGLRFQFKDRDETEFFVSFEKIENVMEPTKGDFPPAMKNKALGAKVGSKAGQLASGLVGNWLGGDTGKAVAKVGSDASKMAGEGSDLGRPPRNRLTVFARLRKTRCKVYFDVNGGDRAEMNEEAGILYKKILRARSGKTGPDDSDLPSGGASGLVVPAPPTQLAGKPFRVLNAGRISGPYSLKELRALLNSGKLGADALIGVETWMPLVTLTGMQSVGGKKAGKAGEKKGEGHGRPGKGTHAAGDETEDEELMEEENEEMEEEENEEEMEEEVEEEENEEDEEPESQPEPDDDNDTLKVGDEFQID